MTPLKKPVRRVTIAPFFNYGLHRDRLFVVSLEPGDLLTLRPIRSRREGASVTMRLVDLYNYALLCRANRGNLEKARAKKAALAEQREHRRLVRSIRGGLS